MNVKKILALLLAAMMVLGMTSAMAADSAGAWTTTENAKGQKDVWLVGSGADGINAVTFQVYYNEGSNNRVKTGFKLTTTAGTAVAAAENKLAVKAGPLGAVAYVAVADTVRIDDTTGSDIATVLFAANDANDHKNVTINIDPTQFTTGAGVYRYVITETITDEMAALGIKATEGTVRYLDVYVTNGTTTNPYKISAVVMTKGDAAPDPTLEDTNANNLKDKATYANKVNSIKNTIGDKKDPDPENPEEPDDPTDDVYGYTFKLKKKVEGGLGDKNEYFPFQVKLTYTDVTADADTTLAGYKVQVAYSAKAKSNGNVSELTFGDDNTLTTTSKDFQIQDGGIITIKGIPAGVKVEVKEEVDANENYTLSSEVTEMGDTTTKVAAADKKMTETTFGTSGVIQKVEDTSKIGTIEYTNTKEEISPTGVVLRFAPYFAMFAAGCVLFLILATKRSKKEEE